ncbi:CAAX amino terminal protease self- immunity [Symmachiella dynata]|uniref:CAAX amino terminal protease self-immunity n=1 Tax=Symmachiella dynata TaxID=2527995 RepID=A0A517ZQZ0_9PLAN|nr:type II CAAX endopeptidase family protein [Symmachiella dynata]QDU44904.1 CAAX amino terminal protease self- immunity [Symmachiella dynata]
MHNEEPAALIFEDEDNTDIPVRRGFPRIAWLVILAMVGFVTYMQNGGRGEPHPLEDEESAPQDIIMLLQSRYLVGAASLWQDQDKLTAHKLYEQAAPLNQGTIEQRLKFAIVAEELAGAEEALSVLSDINDRVETSGFELNNQQLELRDALTALMTDYAAEEWTAPTVTPHQRQLIKDQLGWFGDLALAPKQGANEAARSAIIRSAQQTAIALLGSAGLFCLFLMVGIMVLVLFTAAYVTGSVQSAIHCGHSNHAGIYPETFAFWLLLFFVLTQSASYLVQDDRYRTLAMAAAMFGSLFALAWPRLRGIPWRQIRSDIGWTAGKRPLAEPAIGVGSYIMTIPFLFVGFLASVILMFVTGLVEPVGGGGDEFSPTSLPSHPIVSTVATADWFMVFQLYLVAAIGAPVVEETMFRGVMYRHLRECSHRWGFLLSFLFSALINSFIFAVIHPQGLVAVPALMAIAFGLTLAREWRGTLIPSMIAHGIHNGLLLTVLLLAIGN